MCSGRMRSILNCSSGFSSIATSLLVVPIVLRRRLRGRLAVADRHAEPRHRAVDIDHAGSDPKKKQHDRPPGPRPRPLVDYPAEPGRDHDRHHEFDTDTKAEPHT